MYVYDSDHFHMITQEFFFQIVCPDRLFNEVKLNARTISRF